MCASFRLHSDDAERLTGDGEDSLGPTAIEDSQYYSYAVISEADDGDIRSAVYPVAWRWEETHGDLEVWLDTKDRMGNIVQFSDPDENPNSPVKEGSTVTFYTILSAANSDCQELADAAETYGECTSYTDTTESTATVSGGEIQEIGTCDNEETMCASFRLHSDDAERLTGDGEDSLGPTAIEDSQYYSYAVISEADDGDIRSAVYPVAWRWEETHGDLEVWLDTKDRMGNIVQFSDPDENPNSPVKEGSTVTFYTILSAANSDCQELADAAETYGECTSYTDLSSESDTTESSESDTTESSEPDPWEQVSTKRKCSDLSNINNIASDDECKNLANDAGSIFYAYREDTNKCMHGNSCTEKSTNGNWILYRNSA